MNGSQNQAGAKDNSRTHSLVFPLQPIRRNLRSGAADKLGLAGSCDCHFEVAGTEAIGVEDTNRNQ